MPNKGFCKECNTRYLSQERYHKLYNKKCGPDLAFDPFLHSCVWPGDSTDCNAPAFCTRLSKGYDYEIYINKLYFSAIKCILYPYFLHPIL